DSDHFWHGHQLRGGHADQPIGKRSRHYIAVAVELDAPDLGADPEVVHLTPFALAKSISDRGDTQLPCPQADDRLGHLARAAERAGNLRLAAQGTGSAGVR